MSGIGVGFKKTLEQEWIRCQAKYLTYAKFMIYCCLSVVLLLRVKKLSFVDTFLMCVV